MKVSNAQCIVSPSGRWGTAKRWSGRRRVGLRRARTGSVTRVRRFPNPDLPCARLLVKLKAQRATIASLGIVDTHLTRDTGRGFRELLAGDAHSDDKGSTRQASPSQRGSSVGLTAPVTLFITFVILPAEGECGRVTNEWHYVASSGGVVRAKMIQAHMFNWYQTTTVVSG